MFISEKEALMSIFDKHHIAYKERKDDNIIYIPATFLHFDKNNNCEHCIRSSDGEGTAAKGERDLLYIFQELLEQYLKYNPKGKYLSVSFMDIPTGISISMHNSYWDVDKERPINVDVRFLKEVEDNNETDM